MLKPGYRGREAVIFNGTPYGYKSSRGSYLDIPKPGSVEKFAGMMWKGEEAMRMTVERWEKAGDVFGEGSYYPKDEPEVGFDG
jgi:hypothetical protein